jgi:serralysin
LAPFARRPPQLNGTNLADEIYALAGNDTLIGFDGDDLLDGGPGADELWGGYGFDYASYRGSGAGVYVYLDFGGINGEAQGDQYHLIEGVIGSAFADALKGNDGANVLRGGGGDDVVKGLWGDDTLYGEAGDDLISGSDGIDRLDGGIGDDRLDGGEGDDVLEGGAGVDRFVYGQNNDSQNDDSYQTYDSSPGAPDRILDFSSKQGDRIDLSAVDANAQVTGDQAFQFIGQDAFTAAGQVRFFKAAGDTVVEVNTDDAAPGAEMRIEIDPVVNFQTTDFVL